jgi:hypothetical protein
LLFSQIYSANLAGIDSLNANEGINFALDQKFDLLKAASCSLDIDFYHLQLYCFAMVGYCCGIRLGSKWNIYLSKMAYDSTDFSKPLYLCDTNKFTRLDTSSYQLDFFYTGACFSSFPSIIDPGGGKGTSPRTELFKSLLNRYFVIRKNVGFNNCQYILLKIIKYIYPPLVPPVFPDDGQCLKAIAFKWFLCIDWCQSDCPIANFSWIELSNVNNRITKNAIKSSIASTQKYLVNGQKNNNKFNRQIIELGPNSCAKSGKKRK